MSDKHFEAIEWGYSRPPASEEPSREDERFLRLREVSELLDLPAWYDEARTIGKLGVGEVDGAQWLASWLQQKIAGLDWLSEARATPPLDMLGEVEQAFVPVYGAGESGTRVELANRFRAWLGRLSDSKEPQ